MIDVHKDQQIYLNDPEPAIPASKSGRGRRSRQYKSTEKRCKSKNSFSKSQGSPGRKSPYLKAKKAH
ncbi:MAG: hypothetical protein L3J88_06100 [Gammaproteobacteria bacterium]|nr:hypothetical protein [Gammaproteobacteria bacterium]MCF6362906.1 hypothetical protein [Gammaproteobacteria bacterium]